MYSTIVILTHKASSGSHPEISHTLHVNGKQTAKEGMKSARVEF